MLMQIVEGEECPVCGCRDTAERDAGTWGMQRVHACWCRHCGNQWRVTRRRETEADEGRIVYRTGTARSPEGATCPQCGVFPMRVSKTLLRKRPKWAQPGDRVRYHKCRDCGCCATSVEEAKAARGR